MGLSSEILVELRARAEAAHQPRLNLTYQKYELDRFQDVASPSAVLALLDELDALRAELTETQGIAEDTRHELNAGRSCGSCGAKVGEPCEEGCFCA